VVRTVFKIAEVAVRRLVGSIPTRSRHLLDSALTVHHLFPRKYLSKYRDRAEDANRRANYALLSRPTNSEFHDRPPDEVLSTLAPDERKRAAVQVFDTAAGDRLRGDQYEEFCEWRAQRIAKGLNEWLGLDRAG
jgi:hypothetical protein